MKKLYCHKGIQLPQLTKQKKQIDTKKSKNAPILLLIFLK